MRSLWAAALLVPLVLGLALSAQQVSAQSDSQSMRNRLDAVTSQLSSMRAELQDMQRVVYQGAAPPANASASATSSDSSRQRLIRIESQVDRFEEDMRRVSGRFDEIQHELSSLQLRIDRLVADLDVRLSALDAGGRPLAERPQETGQGGAVSTGATAAVDSGTGYRPSEEPQVLGTIPVREGEQAAQPAQAALSPDAPVLPAGTPEEQYNYAFGLLRQAQYDQAEVVLDAFIEANPSHSLVENAAYWRGETYYARKLYGEAVRIYARNLQSYPKGQKAPDNMVKLGMSLVNLERYQEACQAFDELAKGFPNMPPNVRQAADRGRTVASCS